MESVILLAKQVLSQLSYTPSARLLHLIFLHLRRYFQLLALQKFWSIWSNILRNDKTAADALCFREAHFQFLVEM